ncbi:hypothetical protein SFRURICE_007464 [Spodoptera frugiperda]|nr:hypothetical protein SFRURICE_007464 [Spodoptera frugiperda]
MFLALARTDIQLLVTHYLYVDYAGRGRAGSGGGAPCLAGTGGGGPAGGGVLLSGGGGGAHVGGGTLSAGGDAIGGCAVTLPASGVSGAGRGGGGRAGLIAGALDGTSGVGDGAGGLLGCCLRGVGGADLRGLSGCASPDSGTLSHQDQFLLNPGQHL